MVVNVATAVCTACSACTCTCVLLQQIGLPSGHLAIERKAIGSGPTAVAGAHVKPDPKGSLG